MRPNGTEGQITACSSALARSLWGTPRLAIQDPGEAGNQPFVSLDGRYQCVFNGEIYNYRSLVERYRLPVRNSCDGEIIPHLWSKLGPMSLGELRGMFAIALVDSLEQRLYLARDPFGIKPAYWRILIDGTLVFASEIRPLARIANGVRISGEAIAHYLRFGAMGADQSPFEETSALPPNSVASFTPNGEVKIEAIRPDGPSATFQAPKDLGAALTESIDMHLNADVPTALLLSGGIDSATIAAIGRRLNRSLHCLTVATQDAADESAAASETARHYGHHFQSVPAALDSDDVTSFFQVMQRPSIDGLNTFLIARAVHEAGFKVALSGLGGDEAVGGYNHFRLLRYIWPARLFESAPSPVLDFSSHVMARLGIAGEAKAKRLLTAGGPRLASTLPLLQREVLDARTVGELTGIKVADNFSPPPTIAETRAGAFAAMVATEVAIYLQATLLPDADAFSMAASVELRVPFVDSDVFAASLAYATLTSKTPGKIAIGQSLNDSYLRALAGRPKRGFTVPMRKWMTGPLARVVKDAESPESPVWSVLDREAAERAGLLPLMPRNRWAEAWLLAALNGWLEQTRC